MKEIAAKIGKDKSTVTVLVNKLINLGYLERQKCTNDKRITSLS
ncbi:MarR family winged helix-turn-helix transcriptional regulator [Clostridioides difficile]